MFSLLPLAFLLLLGKAAPAARLTADLDGDGSTETAIAEASGAGGQLRVRDAQGRLLAESAFPLPRGKSPRIALAAGSLGSAGALLAIEALSGPSRCESLWRYREGALTRVPISGASGPVPDCVSGEKWITRFERPSADAPAFYVRERTRRRPDGPFREIEFFRYKGFRLELDPERSSAEIHGVAIPVWSDCVLYRKDALDHLSDRFDLSLVRSEPRARILADRAKGLFLLILRDRRQERSLPVTALVREGKGNTATLTAGAPPRAATLRVVLSTDGKVPVEAAIRGLGGGLDGAYEPVTRQRESAVHVYSSAEQELAQNFLPGDWSGEKGDALEIAVITGSPPIVRFGKQEVALDLDRAPAGTDVLLVPREGSPPSLGLLLRGPNAIETVSVRCAPGRGEEGFACEAEGRQTTWRRQGARVNIR